MAEISLDPIRPEKAIEYWQTRKPLTAKEKRELESGAKNRAMAVAGLHRHKQLAMVYSALEKALTEGRSLADFKKEVRTQLGGEDWGNWRLENVFRTNLATAYAAGAWAGIQATKEAFPYLEYIAVGDDRTRPSHAVLHGKIYPVDHEFWSCNYPPNGFGCRCTTAPVSSYRAKKHGVKVENEMPHSLTYEGPGGYPMVVAAPGADKGFAGNAGQDWLTGLSPNELQETLTFGPPRTVCPISGNFADEVGPCGLPLNKIDQRHILPVKPGDVLPQGKSEEYYALEFLKVFGLAKLDGSKTIRLPGVNLPLAINRDLLTDKLTGQLKANKNGRGIYMRLLAQTIMNPFEIWRVPGEISGKPYQVLRLVRLFAGLEKTIGGFGVFNLVPGRGWKGATAFTPTGYPDQVVKYLERQRAGNLLYREK